MVTAYQHPKSKEVIQGMRLVKGAVLRLTDMYDSTSGKWDFCPNPGLVVGDTNTVWVRPVPLTEDAVILLKYLASMWKGCFDCIAKRSGDVRTYLVVPNPHFNWDRRIETPTVRNPQAIRLLLDLGYLEEVASPRDGDDTEFFVLTDLGREKARQIA